MKQIVLFQLLILTSGIATGQYSWFNRSYPQSAPQKIHFDGDSIHQVGPIQDLLAGIVYLVKNSVNTSNGDFLQNQTTPIADFGGGAGLLLSRDFFQLPDSTWLFFGSAQCEQGGTVYPHILYLDKYFNYQYSRILTEFEPCEFLVEFYPDGMVMLDNDEYLLTTRVDYAFDSSGHYFTKLNLAGELLEQYSFTLPGFGVSQNYYGMERHGSDSLVIWGDGGVNYTSYGAMVQKTDMHGSVGQELHLANGGLSLSEPVGTALMSDSGDLIMARLKAIWVNSNIGVAIAHPRFQRIDLNSMAVVQDEEYIFPEVEDTLQYFSSFDIVKGQDGGYLGLYEIGSAEDGLGDAHALLIKVDENLQEEWHRFYYPPNAPANAHGLPFDIEPTPDGGYVIGGGVLNSNEALWIIKIDNCGYEVENGCPEFEGIDESLAEPVAVKLWPNPFQTQLKALLPQNATRIFISDATGRIVFEESVFYPNQTWNLSSLSDGVYVINVELESGITVSERIVKR